MKTIVKTGMKDDAGKEIMLGDTLRCKWGYDVTVYQGIDGTFYGKLVCDPSHLCANISYALNNGKGHVVLQMRKLKNTDSRDNILIFLRVFFVFIFIFVVYTFLKFQWIDYQKTQRLGYTISREGKCGAIHTNWLQRTTH